MIDTVLRDRYRVDRRIGRGGFATVYRGQDLTLKRPIAIKFLEEADGQASFKQRFLREAESMAGLSHPNIVTVFDCAEHNGQPYMVMELVDGPSLLELTAQEAPTIVQLCSIGQQVSSAMSYAHQQGVIHRDLSLQNVLVKRDENGDQQAKILDFGLAKLIHEEALTSGHHMLGTLFYMAPEQIQNEQIDGRADIFAFGVGLYRMVSGRFPFEAEHPASIIYLILNETQLDFPDEIPQRMRDLIGACLEKDPRNRLGSFDEIGAELRAIEHDEQPSAGSAATSLPGLDRFSTRGSKRNPYLNRVMISHPSEFFGREREVRKVYSRLDAPHPQSISVVGERRIGKSSLLNYIYHPRNRASQMQNHEKALFAYLDFQRDAQYDVPRFIDFLLNMFSFETNTDAYASRERTLDELRNVVQDLDAEGKRIIILMDEFEIITCNPKFEESFFSFLRSLANSYRVAYVTSSHEDLQKMCHNQDISDSPFFNIFANMPLRPFTREEALQLIIVPSRTEGLPLEPHADRILELSGTFPLFIQIACSCVFESLIDKPEGPPDWDQVERSFLDEVDQHYRFVWERMDDGSRENLARIATGKSISRKHRFVTEELERRGYLVESNEGPKLCSASFRDFVMKQAERSRGRGLLGVFGRK